MDFLERLLKFDKLLDINVLNNPIEQGYSCINVIISEVIMRKPTIKRFCKLIITDVHRLEAVYLKQFKWAKSEVERKRKALEEGDKSKDE